MYAPKDVANTVAKGCNLLGSPMLTADMVELWSEDFIPSMTQEEYDAQLTKGNVTLEGNPVIRNSQGGGIIGGGKAGSVILQHSATLSPFTVSTAEQRRIQFSAAVNIVYLLHSLPIMKPAPFSLRQIYI